MKLTTGFLFMLLAFPFWTSAQHNTITVRGSVEFPREGEMVKIILQDGFSRTAVDSIPMNPDGTFEKKVGLPKAGRYTLSGHDQQLSFWGDNEDIEVHMRGVDTAKIRMIVPYHIQIVNPGPDNDLMNLLSFFSLTANNEMYAAGREIYEADQSGEEAWKKYASQGYNRNREFARGLFDYLGTSYMDRNSSIALLPLVSDEVREQVLAYLEQNKPDYPPYVEYKEGEAYKAAQKEKLAAGRVAPEFAYPTPDGKQQLGPDDFRGKYLLIDFWASWCGPCRKSIPMLKEIYEKYHEQGFEILSVSIDRDQAAWRRAMTDENMPWPQVLAPESGKDVQKVYQFTGIPHVVLLDRDGRIVVREIYGEDIREAVSKVFD